MGDRVPHLRSVPRSGPEAWPQPMTAPRMRLELTRREPKRLYTIRICGPSTEGEPVTIAGVTIAVVATSLLMIQPGDIATVECTESDDV